MTVRAQKKPKVINVIGKKDPRGPDNTIKIWLDETGRLCISVDKPHVRCYPFSHIEENECSITVIQNK
jgi:hypothetical protein